MWPPPRRGIGTFVRRESTEGQGIRRYPYSTDMDNNPGRLYLDGADARRYRRSTRQFQHAKGEIWAATTWDLYWAMVEKYGYDADINNANSGNARAIQLVMDGMKLQP